MGKAKVASMVLLVALILGLSISATTEHAETIDELLAPYQAVIDKVNADLGTTIYIPEENKEKVYNSIKGMSLNEVEALLKSHYKNTITGKPAAGQSGATSYIKDTIYGD